MKRIQSLVLLVLFISFTLVSCGGDSNGVTSPSQNAGVPFTVTDLQTGSGATATPGSTITVNYTGWLYDGNAAENKGAQFDSGQGFQFVLGAGQVIAGWDQGFDGMQVGGTRRLIIPPDMAYGSQGRGPIPPNATLVFDVELVAVS